MCSFPPQIKVLESHQHKILSLCNMQHGLWQASAMRYRNPKQTFCAVEDKSPLLLSGPLICLFSCVRFAEHRPKLLRLVKKDGERRRVLSVSRYGERGTVCVGPPTLIKKGGNVDLMTSCAV